MKKILLLFVFASLQLNAQEQQRQYTISVSGEGIVEVIPDEVILNIRVEHMANNAKEAKDRNDEAVNNVLKFCKKMNIDRKDIRTQYVNLNKNYDYQEKRYQYSANQAIHIVLRDLKKYEALMQGLLDSGTNRIDGIAFQSSELEKHQAEARKKAIHNARQKAKEYAGALQQHVGNAITISENAVYDPRAPILNKAMSFDEAASSGIRNAGGPTIAIGEIKVSATVQVTFELKTNTP